MKLRKSLLQICALILAAVTLAPSQTLDGLKLIAHYPLKDSANDTLGNYDPVQLINTPFQDGGVYCNGNQLGVDPDSCYLATPFIDGFTMNKFAISARFKISDDYGFRRPIFVCGNSWRWMFVFLTPEQHIGFGYNDTFGTANASEVVVARDVWHTVAVVYDSSLGRGELYYDGALIDTALFVLDHDNDKTFSIQHGGTGTTFKGFLADLEFYAEDGTAAAIGNTLMRPRAFNLQQNYPNPFNPTTTIEFAIQKTGDYELALYSTNGRKVRTLLRENLAIRTYSFTFTASNLPSGVYICKLQGEGESQVRRLVLLK